MTGLRARIIGIGQDTAGDDGIGIAVARRLGQMKLPNGIEVIESAEPSAIIAQLMDGVHCVVLVDAIVDEGSAGRLLEIDPARSGSFNGRPLSTHGVGLLEAIELARTLDEAIIPDRIVIIGITIERPRKYEAKLSDAVAAAIQPAAELAVRLASG